MSEPKYYDLNVSNDQLVRELAQEGLRKRVIQAIRNRERLMQAQRRLENLEELNNRAVMIVGSPR